MRTDKKVNTEPTLSAFQCNSGLGLAIIYQWLMLSFIAALLATARRVKNVRDIEQRRGRELIFKE